MKKKSLMLIMSMTLAVLLIAGGTFAWFTANADPVVNEFEAGTLIMSVQECFNACDAANVNPGDCIKKNVRFHNDGTKRMFVRVDLAEMFENTEGDALDPEGIISYDIGDNWILHTDGYYYYTEEVDPEEYTGKIITKVCFDGPAMDNDYQGSKFTLTVISEAIQVTNGAATDVWGIYPPDLVEAP